MVSEEVVTMLGNGIAASLAIVVGACLLRLYAGGFEIPVLTKLLSGNR